MENFITDVQIERFKSLKSVHLADCKKVNILLGKPNVGKTSILEALSLFGTSDGEEFFAESIHYETISNLFYDQEIAVPLVITAQGLGLAGIRYFDSVDTFSFSTFKDTGELKTFTAQKGIGNLVSKIYPSGKYNDRGKSATQDYPVRKYSYRRRLRHDNPAQNYLLPPSGANLVAVLQTHSELRRVITPLFEQYGLELALDASSRTLSIQKRKDGLVYSVPYSLVANTLQRIVLYISALYSNHHAVLLLEEPEAHSFPPYTKMLADYITLDETNQFFIATHSPYFLDAMLTQSDIEVAVFVVEYHQYQTVARRLSEKQLDHVRSLGTMVFANLDKL